MTTLSPATSDTRTRLHDMTLAARAVLLGEVRAVLEGVFGIDATGRMEDVARLPAVLADPTIAATRTLLVEYLAAEHAAGVAADRALAALEREVAFTWLNRLAAFKLLEARGLIRLAVGRSRESAGFKLWLAEDGNEAMAALADAGDLPEDGLSTGPHDRAYRHFLLHLCAEQAREIAVLFDPTSLSSRLCPRPRALKAILDLINDEHLQHAWEEIETIGWIYQNFNSEELEAAFRDARESGKKFDAEDIPAVTQLFTPRWVVETLVENTLGRLWVQMHPDSKLAAELAALVVEVDAPRVTPRPVREITLLDPACGTMHFGLVAFDLFYEMYEEELARAGEPGWPATPSVARADEIPTAIIANNLYGMDIDLRAVQLAALALLLKARSRNRQARVTAHHLVCASVLPARDQHVETFLAEAQFTQPVYARLVRGIWQRLADAPLLGSLMRLEADVDDLVKSERAKARTQQALPGFGGEQFETAVGRAEFWHVIAGQVVRAFDEFAQRHATEGLGERIFTSDAARGFALFDLMLRRYDVVVTNPPYLSARKMNERMKKLISTAYPHSKQDTYAVFIERNLEFAKPGGRVGMLTMQSFMSITRYEDLRADILNQAAIEVVTHYGPALFMVGNPGTLQTASFVLRREPDAATRARSRGAYLRLVREPDPAAKQRAYARAVAALRAGERDPHAFRYCQGDFAAIPGAPWVYYITPTLRDLFTSLPKLGDAAQPRQGLATADNFRFLRMWWEVGQDQVGRNFTDGVSARLSQKRWFPYMKGGSFQRWWGNQEYTVNWFANGQEIKCIGIETGKVASRPQNTEYYFQRGVTWSKVSSGRFSTRLSPGGFIFDVAGCSVFIDPESINVILGITNSTVIAMLLRYISPTVNYEVGHIASLPIPTASSATIHELVERAIALQRAGGAEDETTYEFVAPPPWATGLAEHAARARELAAIEAAIDEEVYRLYGISDADRAVIAAELASATTDASDAGEAAEDEAEDESAERDDGLSAAELALRWVSYAVGIVLGRFAPGAADGLGRGAVSPAQAAALRALVMPEGLATLDAGHPHDLAVAVQRALETVLGEADATAVVRTATGGGDLRDWLARDFWKDHLRRYRKRPIYWLLQSPKRKASYLLFHERASVDTLSTLAGRRFAAGQLYLLDTELDRLIAAKEAAKGNSAAVNRLQRELEPIEERARDLRGLLDHVNAIIQQTDADGVTVGWRPERDDGVLINLAPLHPLLPSWTKEPRDCWAALADGKYDWSRTAMRYWPDRVRRACAANPSYAIAHGHDQA